MPRHVFHADLNETAQIFLGTELQAIETELQRTPFGPKKALELIPLDDSIPEGAREWGFDRVTAAGIAEWIAADPTKIPMADVSRKRVLFPVHEMALGYYLSLTDIAAAQMAGLPLEREKAYAVRDGIDQKQNNTWLLGDASMGLEGFINSAVVTAGNVTRGSWESATPDEILRDMNDEVLSVRVTTKEVYEPTTIVVPLAQYSIISTTARSANSDKTILEYFLANNPGVEVRRLAQLAGAGVSGTDRMITYRKDKQVLTAKASFLFKQQPAQPKGLGQEVICWAKIGGCAWRVPIAAKYGDGI